MTALGATLEDLAPRLAAEPALAEEAARLHRLAFAEAIAGRPWTAREFVSLSGQPGVFLLLSAQGVLVGRTAGPEAELITLGVAPEARGRGEGARLAAAFAAQVLARGAQEAFLEVAKENAPARALYARCGWTQAGTRRDYYKLSGGRRCDALVLRLNVCSGSPAGGGADKRNASDGRQ